MDYRISSFFIRLIRLRKERMTGTIKAATSPPANPLLYRFIPLYTIPTFNATEECRKQDQSDRSCIKKSRTYSTDYKVIGDQKVRLTKDGNQPAENLIHRLTKEPRDHKINWHYRQQKVFSPIR